MQYITDMPPRPQQSTVPLSFPTTQLQVLDTFRKHLKSIARAPGRKIVAIMDAISSKPGVLLPWEEMVKVCKEEGVWSVIDAAHAIGQQPNINMKAADPDFWVSVWTTIFETGRVLGTHL